MITQTYELRKCSLDEKYWLDSYCYIVHPHLGKTRVSTTPIQNHLLGIFEKFKNIVIAKARQTRMSSTAALHVLWLTLFKSDIRVIMVSPKPEMGKYLLEKVRYAYKNLPDWMQIPLVTDNRWEMKFINGSRIKCITRASDLCSEHAHVFVVDEAAYVDKLDEILLDIRRANHNAKIIMYSTVRTDGDTFACIYKLAEKGLNEYVAVRVTWRDNPEFTYDRYKRHAELIGEEHTRTELDAKFTDEE